MCSFAIAVYLLGGSTLQGQVTTGQIRGIVSDGQGLSILQARVVIRNEQTGQTLESITNDLGNYLISAIPIGKYSISVEHPGFKRYTRTGIELVGGQFATIDITLEVGTVVETVTVSDALTQVNTTTGTLGTLIDSKRLTDLPLNGRNILALAALTPGVTRAGLANGPSNGQQVINVNGNRSYSTNLMLDGASMYHAHRGQGLIAPPPEAVQEVQVITNGVTAEHGRGSAAISAVTRSGTNEFHGSLWNFFRNDVMDARSFFARTVPKLRYNQFGGTMGGPIRRNKAFFFGSYQRLEQRADRVQSNAFPPTAEERVGNYSNSRDPRPVDPLNNQLFPGGIIPRARLDPVAVRLAERFPLPNQPNGTYLTQRSIPTQGDMIMGRVDYDFSPADRTSFRFFRDNPSSANPFAQSHIDNYAASETANFSRSMNANHTHTFNPNVLLNGRFNYTSFSFQETNLDRLTLSDFGSQFLTGGGPGSLPFLFIAGRMNAASAREGQFASDIYEGAGDLSWFRGKHEIKFGAMFQRVRYLIQLSGRSYGEFQFNGTFTKSPMADFFLGSAASLRQEAFRNNDVHYWVPGMYIQDRWRVSRTFTLNLGLRYEIYTPWRAFDGQFSALMPGQQSRRFPTAPPGLIFQEDAQFPHQTDAINFGPRIGFAWDVFGTGKTSIRGGYAVSYDPMVGQVAAQNSPPFAVDLLTTNVGPLTNPQGNLAINPYANPPNLQNPVWPLPLALTTSFSGRVQTAYSQNINLTIEQQVMRDLLVQASYVSSLGRKITNGLQQNPAVYIPGNSTVRNADERRLFFPNYGSVYAYTTDANSSYHGFQMAINKRFARSYSILVGYTYAKAIDEIGTSEVAHWQAQDPDNRRGDRALGDFDIRQRLVLSWIWEIPFMRQKHDVTSRILGGWNFAGIANMQDGRPLSIVSGRDNSVRGLPAATTNTDRPDLRGDPRLPTDRPKAERLARYFDATMFTHNLPGQFGNAPRNFIIGPGAVNFDLMLNKKVPLWSESRTLEIRADMFNAFNRANFNNPGSNLASTASFGRITAAGPGRIMQLALKIEF